MSLRNWKKSSKGFTEELSDTANGSADPLFLWKVNKENRLKYDKLNKNWTESWWQQVLWSDESYF